MILIIYHGSKCYNSWCFCLSLSCVDFAWTLAEVLHLSSRLSTPLCLWLWNVSQTVNINFFVVLGWDVFAVLKWNTSPTAWVGLGGIVGNESPCQTSCFIIQCSMKFACTLIFTPPPLWLCVFVQVCRVWCGFFLSLDKYKYLNSKSSC